MTELKSRIHDKSNGLDYVLVGDYYVPDLKLPEEHRPIGMWGRLHRTYLEQYRPTRFSALCLSGELHTYLADLDEQATERCSLIIEQMKQAEGVTETMKADNQMLWVQSMNSIRNRAEACVLLTQKRNEKDYEFEIEVSLMIDSDRLFEDSRPTYTNIRKYVFDKYGIKLQLKDIADVKRDYGMKMKVNKHLIKGDEPVRRKCTPNKRKYIIEALKYYHAI